MIQISQEDEVKIFLLKAKKMISVGRYDFFDKKEENMNFEIELMTDEEYKEKPCSKKEGLTEEEKVMVLEKLSQTARTLEIERLR